MKTINLVFLLTILQQSCTGDVIPLCDIGDHKLTYPIIAHSHNDYEQDLPIITALNHGFISLEVDIAYDGSDIRISHDEDDLEDKPIFETHYLQPLIKQALPDSATYILLVDIKNYSESLLRKLNQILEKYKENLVSRTAPQLRENKIHILLSGDIPRETILQDSSSTYLFVDGRLNAFDLEAPEALIPLISMDYTDISNQLELKAIIKQVHDQNKKIRFWKTKDKEDMWLNLIELEVDIIGVDDIELFCAIMQKNGLLE